MECAVRDFEVRECKKQHLSTSPEIERVLDVPFLLRTVVNIISKFRLPVFVRHSILRIYQCAL